MALQDQISKFIVLSPTKLTNWLKNLGKHVRMPDASKKDLVLVSTNTADKYEWRDIDSSVKQNSTNLITSGAVSSAITDLVTSSNELIANEIVIGNDDDHTVKSSGLTITTNTPTSSSTDSTVPTSKAVWGAIKDMVGPMIYKGTVGTGGTVTTLPTTNVLVGHTYKVATAGTYANSESAKPGDTYICSGVNGNTITWTLIPSGDELDILVRQTASSTNTTYPLLASSSSNPTSGSAYEAIYDTLIKINPNKHSVQIGSYSETPIKTSIRLLTATEKQRISDTYGITFNFVCNSDALDDTVLYKIYATSDTSHSNEIARFTVSMFDELWLCDSSYGNRYGDLFNVNNSALDSLTTTPQQYIFVPIVGSLGEGTFTEGTNTLALNSGTHAEGFYSSAFGEGAHAEGTRNNAYGASSHAEGIGNIAYDGNSHAEGAFNVAFGGASHAEGRSNVAKGNYSHAEGRYTKAMGDFSHTEGYRSDTGGTATSNSKTAGTETSSGIYAHAEGNATIAKGVSSHSEGEKTFASGKASHAGGLGTTANQEAMTAIGKYNAAGVSGDLFVVGNGTSSSGANAFRINGNDAILTGGLKKSSNGSNTTFWNTNGGTKTASEIMSSALGSSVIGSPATPIYWTGTEFSTVQATFGNASYGTRDANAMTSNGLWYYSSNGPSTSLGATTGDGALYSQAYSSSWVGLIAQDYRNGSLFVRSKKDGTWQEWKKVWDSGNFTPGNYLPLAGDTMTGPLTTPSLTVTGSSSFSQAINGSILGNAATASRLLNARTISLTGNVTGSGTFDGSGNLSISTTVNSGTATKLSTTSKTAWGQTYWTSEGIPTNISGNMTSVGTMLFNNMALAKTYTDNWSDGTHSHPWYGYDARYNNTGVYSTTISDYYGLTLRTGSGNLSITNAGNVGIGTYTPGVKLEVSGDVRITGNDLYIGSASGSQCHQVYDSTNKVLKFLFD